jgi:hypothetical protein
MMIGNISLSTRYTRYLLLSRATHECMTKNNAYCSQLRPCVSKIGSVPPVNLFLRFHCSIEDCTSFSDQLTVDVLREHFRPNVIRTHTITKIFPVYTPYTKIEFPSSSIVGQLDYFASSNIRFVFVSASNPCTMLVIVRPHTLAFKIYTSREINNIVIPG